MKKKLTALLSVLLILTTVACSSAASETGPDIDQPVSGSQEKTDPAGASQPSAQTAPEDAEPAETQPAASTEATVETQVLLDSKDILITLTGLESDGLFGPALKVLIENNSDTDVTIQTRGTSVNGYMAEAMMSAEVAAGKKANNEITFMASDLDEAGISAMADIELAFHIFTTDGWDTYLDSKPIQIKTSLADGWDYTYDDAGEVLYDKKDMRIIAKGISEDDSIFGPGLVLFIENLSKESITVQARDVSVNGFMIDGSMSAEVSSGKRAITALTFFSSDLEDNSIETISDIELAFHIFETDGWDTITDTEKYVLNFD